MKTFRYGVLALGVLFVLCGAAMAQDQNRQDPNRQRGRGGPPGRGNFDPNQFRDQMFNRIRDQLAVSDDEWKVLAPKVDHAYTAQREARTSGRTSSFSTRDRGNDPNRAPDPNQTALSKAIADLQAAVNDKAPTEELTRRVGIIRELRDKARAEYTAAQKDLKELITSRQEAILVSTGILE
jgi:hypothetical protein